MLNQTPEQKASLSVRIEHLIETDLKQTIGFYINRYKKTFDRKLGLTEDDLMNDIREQVWKGLLTWNAKGKANLKTYLNSLISNRFLTLLKKSSIDKYSSLEYYADAYAAASIDPDLTVTEDTGESVFERRQEMLKDKEVLSDDEEQKIFSDLILGYSIPEMMTRHKLARVKVISLINKINKRVSERRSNTSRGAL